MARPSTTIITPLAVAPAVTSWTYAGVLAALNEHENGQFSASADLADAFGRDDRIRGCLATRVHSLLGRHGAEFSLEESDRGNKASAKRYAREVKSWWWRLAPEKTLSRILRDALLLGVSVSRRVWIVAEGQWIPTLQPWPMQHVWWNDTLKRYQTNTAEHGVITIDPEDPGWFVLEMDAERSWMAGAVRALGFPFLLRTFNWRDWARFCERHGMPIIAIKEPSDASDQDKETFFERMRKLGREGVLRLPQMDADTGFDVSFVEAKDRGWETFKGFKQELNTAIAICLLGQNLTTEVSGGGSYAAVRGHGRVLQVYVDSDAERFATGLREGITKPWLRYNYGVEEELAPWPHWDTSLPEDTSARATTFDTAGRALVGLLKAGVRVDVQAYAERFGIPLLEGDPLEEPPEPEPEPEPEPGPEE